MSIDNPVVGDTPPPFKKQFFLKVLFPFPLTALALTARGVSYLDTGTLQGMGHLLGGGLALPQFASKQGAKGTNTKSGVHLGL